MSAIVALFARDLRLAFRHGGDTLTALGFFVLVVVLIPFGVGPEPNLLARIGVGVLWVGALLASLLALERLFAADYEDGTLDLLILGPLALEWVTLAKVAAHWLTTGLPLILISPLLAVLVRLPEGAYVPLLAALLLGTPTLSLIGAVGAALVLGARRGGVLLSVLVLPLYVPVLVFGAAAVDTAAAGFAWSGPMLLLGALLLASLALAPLAAAAALRQAAE